MELDYLIFDFSDEETGCGSFDAMACVLAQRVPALLREVQLVLRWAHREFGAPSADGDWDVELHGTTQAQLPWRLAYDPGSGEISFAEAGDHPVTLTLTISGSRGFCEAFRAAFSI
jgi:hypothetical protein